MISHILSIVTSVLQQFIKTPLKALHTSVAVGTQSFLQMLTPEWVPY